MKKITLVCSSNLTQQLAQPNGGGQRQLLFLKAARLCADQLDIINLHGDASSTVATSTEALKAVIPLDGVSLKQHIFSRPGRSRVAAHAMPLFNAEYSDEFYRYSAAEVAGFLRSHIDPSANLVLLRSTHVACGYFGRNGPKASLPVALDIDDIPHVKLQRSTQAAQIDFRAFLAKRQVGRVKALEQKIYPKVDQTIVSSNHDQRYLSLAYPLNTAPEVVPNFSAVPRSPANQASRQPNTYLFVGDLRYGPNLAGLSEFTAKVWPRILATRPDSRLFVAGKLAQEDALGTVRAARNIELLGYVENLQSLYSACAVCICPIFSGAGTRVKLIEAFLHQAPVVSTHLGAEGLDVVNEQEALIVDRIDQMADPCLKLARDIRYGLRLAENAYQRMHSVYSEDSVSKRLQQVLYRVAKER